MKESVDLDGLNENTAKYLDSAEEGSTATVSGVAGSHIVEAVPKYIQSHSEKVIEGPNNASIVMGRDRPASRTSGYGGRGDTQCASIDLVVGRGAATPKSDMYVDPNFRKDAARIYMSQKTDIDENFSLAEGNIGSAKAKSGIALKADGIRLIARDGIKIVTGTDSEDSQGGSVDAVLGLDIIAGNDDSGLQPFPKGDNLIKALEGLLEQVGSLSGIVSTFLASQQELNGSVSTHTHTAPYYGIKTAPSLSLKSAATKTQANQTQDCTIGLQKLKSNIASYKTNFLRPCGECYINSRYHKLN